MVRDFEDQLRRDGVTPVMVSKVRTALSMLIGDAQRGFVNRNVVRELRRGRERKADRRQKGKLKVGVDIPTPDEIRAIIAHLHGRWRPLLLTAIFCGLRSSDELRGLRWQHIDFAAKEIHVRQRADRYHAIGRPKSEAGERTVPIPAPVLNALREWKLTCPKGELDLAFPNVKGKIESRGNIITRALIPIEIKAGVTVATIDKEGKPAVTAKYTGLHAFRHFFASWCINRKADGGLELPAKVVQERLGHSYIGMTMDVYGHLFPRGDDGAGLATAAAHLFAAT
jgi:integrase